MLALELGLNVGVNAVAPGLIDTPLTQSLEPEVLQRPHAWRSPRAPRGQPVDVAHTVAFLLSTRPASFFHRASPLCRRRQKHRRRYA
ncbi:MAG: SDR family oxidoreductase [Flavobacteriales bacterium]|nr:SDR family oxidoreductase [Flavobacteriales bacterium]